MLPAASAVVSLAIGSVVALGVVAPALPSTLEGPLSALAELLDAHTTAVGLAVVGLFVSALAAAMARTRQSGLEA